jgi:hypothetical protein
MISTRRLSCIHEASHHLVARHQRIAVLRSVVPFKGTLEASDGYSCASGKTYFGITRANLPSFGARAAIALLAGGLGERMAGGENWLDGSASDFEQAIEALKYTKIDYAELVRQTEQIIRDHWGAIHRLADYLEAYGEIDAAAVNEIFRTWRG